MEYKTIFSNNDRSKIKNFLATHFNKHSTSINEGESKWRFEENGISFFNCVLEDTKLSIIYNKNNISNKNIKLGDSLFSSIVSSFQNAEISIYNPSLQNSKDVNGSEIEIAIYKPSSNIPTINDSIKRRKIEREILLTEREILKQKNNIKKANLEIQRAELEIKRAKEKLEKANLKIQEAKTKLK
jgi:hypothetical protein